MDHQRYFKILSPDKFPARFVTKEFIDAGWREANTYDQADVSIYITNGRDDTLPTHTGKLVIISSFEHPYEGALSEGTLHILTPYIIGTGMKGLMREIVAMVGRGSMFFVDGNHARVSVIHASDLARLAVKLCNYEGVFTVSDSINPTWNELIEALSARVGHKRISTFGKKLARLASLAGVLWGGPDKRMLNTLSTDNIIEVSHLPFEFKPVNTVEYLKTHEYTDDDL